MVQYCVFNVILERMFPGRSFKKVTQKVLSANFVTDPILFFPTFYIFKETLDQHSFDKETIVMALKRYKQNCFMDWRNSWALWIPGHVIAYALVPIHLRIPFMATISFGYVCWLSASRGDMAKESSDKDDNGGPNASAEPK